MNINQVASPNIQGLNVYQTSQTGDTGAATKGNNASQPPASQPEQTPKTDQVSISPQARARLAENTEPVEQAPPPPPPPAQTPAEPSPQPQDITTYNAAGEIAG